MTLIKRRPNSKQDGSGVTHGTVNSERNYFVLVANEVHFMEISQCFFVIAIYVTISLNI